jgi:bacterial/archaeal transporter family-2 protein
MNANAGWIIPFIIVGGALQSCGAAMNGQLNKHIVNPWLASAVSFALITFFFAGASLIHPQPLPTQKELAELPWWAVIGGLVGAVQVYAGLTLVNKVGAGPFVGFTVTAALRRQLPRSTLFESARFPLLDVEMGYVFDSA